MARGTCKNTLPTVMNSVEKKNEFVVVVISLSVFRTSRYINSTQTHIFAAH